MRNEQTGMRYFRTVPHSLLKNAVLIRTMLPVWAFAKTSPRQKYVYASWNPPERIMNAAARKVSDICRPEVFSAVMLPAPFGKTLRGLSIRAHLSSGCLSFYRTEC